MTCECGAPPTGCCACFAGNEIRCAPGLTQEECEAAPSIGGSTCSIQAIFTPGGRCDPSGIGLCQAPCPPDTCASPTHQDPSTCACVCDASCETGQQQDPDTCLCEEVTGCCSCVTGGGFRCGTGFTQQECSSVANIGGNDCTLAFGVYDAVGQCDVGGSGLCQ
jgi:hypothetical protein